MNGHQRIPKHQKPIAHFKRGQWSKENKTISTPSDEISNIFANLFFRLFWNRNISNVHVKECPCKDAYQSCNPASLKLTFFLFIFLFLFLKSKDNQCSVLGKTPLHGQIYMSKCSTIETEKREINENSLTTQILAMDCSNQITSNWKINIWNSKSKTEKVC